MENENANVEAADLSFLNEAFEEKPKIIKTDDDVPFDIVAGHKKSKNLHRLQREE